MEPKSAAWWEAQWGQLKAELDALNPKYDAAAARVRDLEAALEDCRAARAAAEADRDRVKAHADGAMKAMADEIGIVRGDAESANAMSAACGAENARLTSELAEANAGRLAAEKQAAAERDRRRAVLGKVLAAAGADVAECNAGLQGD